MGSARILLTGSIWVAGGQLVVFIGQFVYIAITSRVLTTADFGAFAVATTMAALVVLIANGGLSQSVMRAPKVSPKDLGAFVSVGLVAGLAGALLLLATSGLWASVWGEGSARPLLQLASVSVLAMPVTAVLQGFMRRSGGFRRLAILSAVASVAGFSAGAILAITLRSPLALSLGSILTQVMLCTGLAVSIGPACRPRTVRRELASDLAFSLRVMGSNVLSFLSGNVGKFAVSRFFGAAVLGTWNRSEAITLAPFQLVQASTNQVVYPSLGKGRPRTSLFQEQMVDMQCLMAWLTVPAAAFLSLGSPVLVPFVLGPEWTGAVSLTLVLALVAGLTPVTSLLGSLLEIRAHFRNIYGAQVLQIVTQSVFVAVAVWVSSAVWIAWGLLAAQVVRHVIQVPEAVRAGLLDGRRLVIGYLQVGLAAAAAGGVAAGCTGLTDRWALPSWGGVLLLLVGMLLVLATCALIGRRLPLYGICQRRGLLTRRSRMATPDPVSSSAC